jgi:hypothetical protein
METIANVISQKSLYTLTLYRGFTELPCDFDASFSNSRNFVVSERFCVHDVGGTRRRWRRWYEMQLDKGKKCWRCWVVECAWIHDLMLFLFIYFSLPLSSCKLMITVFALEGWCLADHPRRCHLLYSDWIKARPTLFFCPVFCELVTPGISIFFSSSVHICVQGEECVEPTRDFSPWRRNLTCLFIALSNRY